MKKATALFIAVLMIFSLFACSNQGTTSSPAASSAPSAAASPSKAPSVAPSPSAAPSQAASPSAAASPSQAASPSANKDVTASQNSAGFFTDGIDPASRKAYTIVWGYPRAMALMQNINKSIEELGKKLNYKTIGYCANNDMDAYLQNVQIYIDQKVDGFALVFDPTTNMRFKEILDEAKKPYVAVLNSVRDASGSEVIPCVGIDSVLAGQVLVQWLYDNYKPYWGDIDKTQIGLLDFTFSPNKDFRDRHDGSLAKFKELLPNNKQIFDADGVVGTLNEETGYNLASAIFAAHSEVKYWFVPACLEGFAAGATRAAEAAKIDKNCLITCVNSDVLSAQWDTGYSGCFASCLALSDYQYAIPSVCALVALLDGKATPDSLWASERAKTDKVTFHNIPPKMVTKDTYKAFFAQVKKDAGL